MSAPPPPAIRGPSGFTLIELLTVIAIIAVLAALAYPTARGAMEKSKDGKCLSNLRQLGAASMLYVSERGHFPVSFATGQGGQSNWQRELEPFLGSDSNVKRCPAAVLPNLGDNHYSLNQNVFYDPNASADRFKNPQRPFAIEKPAEVILIMDGLQNAAGDAQGGMTQFRGSDGPGQRDTVVNPFQNQAADGKAGGGFPSYRHHVRSDTDRAAHAVFADGHAAPVKWGTVKNRNLVFKVR